MRRSRIKSDLPSWVRGERSVPSWFDWFTFGLFLLIGAVLVIVLLFGSAIYAAFGPWWLSLYVAVFIAIIGGIIAANN